MGPVRSLAFSGADTLLCGDDGNNLKAFVRFVAAARSQRSVLLLFFIKLSVECLSRLIVFIGGSPPSRRRLLALTRVSFSHTCACMLAHACACRICGTRLVRCNAFATLRLPTKTHNARCTSPKRATAGLVGAGRSSQPRPSSLMMMTTMIGETPPIKLSTETDTSAINYQLIACW